MKKGLLLLLLAISNMSAIGQAGSVDSSFGVSGMFHTRFQQAFPSQAQISQRVLAHHDGSLYVAISAGATYITHRFADGSLDINYGEDGYSVPLVNGVAGLILQPDGRIVVGTTVVVNNKRVFAVTMLTSKGAIDKGFGNNGSVHTDFSASENNLIDITIQGDGKIIAMGRAKIGNTFHLAIARYLPGGMPDHSFSDDGRVSVDFSGWLNAPHTVAVDNQERIVVGGSTVEQTPNLENISTFSVVRFLANGSVDSSFLSADRMKILIGRSSAASDLAIQADGKIVVAGQSSGFQPGISNLDLAVVRLDTNGKLDSSFSHDGIQTTNYQVNRDEAFGVAIDSSGKIVVAGYTSAGIIPGVVVVTYLQDGSLDRIFTGASGISIWPTSMALQPDAKVLISGYAHNAYVPDYWVLRFDADGSLDETFGTNGKLSDYKPNARTEYYASVIQPDGKIVTAGRTYSLTDADVAVARYEKDGKPDHSFSDDGKVILRFDGGDDNAYAIALQEDGKIVIAGYTFNGSDRDMALARLNADGTPDLSFSGDGLLVTDLNGSTEEATSLSIQPDGKIVVGGSTTNGGNSDFFLARYLQDGTPDVTFSNDGQLITDIGSTSDSLVDLIILPDARILAVGNYDVRGQSAFVIARYLPDGSLDLSYNGTGMLVTDMGNRKAVAASAGLHEDGKLIVAGTSDGHDFLLVRYQQDGMLDTTFGNAGKLVFDMGSASETATSLSIQSNGKMLVAGYLEGTRNTDFAIVRFTSDGMADSLFSDDGKAIIDGGFGNDRIYSLSISADHAYAIGTSDYVGVTGAGTALFIDDTNKPPIAGAYLQKYTSPVSILLAAWGSYDPDGGNISYLWQKESAPEGDTSTLMYGTSASPVINGVIPGDYAFRLTITDSDGSTATTVLKFTVAANQPPVAGTWLQKYYSPTSALLAAWGSYDPEGWPISYWWEKTAGPDGSTIMYENSASPVITGLANGTYTYLLTVKDFHGAAATSALTFTVDINLPPIAGAWLQKYYSPTTVLLAAWDSHDPEGGPISYFWEKTAGPDGSTLLYRNSASPVVTGLVDGTYTFRLTVTDERGATGMKELTFTVKTVPLSGNIAGQSLPEIIADKAGQFIIYPNPVTEWLKFHWTGDYTGDALLTVMDISGKKVQSVRIRKSGTGFNGNLDVTNLKPGQYYLYLTNGKQKLMSVAFIKQ
jgi:uncharacterized delta-60 repeat protein